jgi:hypothetical protein
LPGIFAKDLGNHSFAANPDRHPAERPDPISAQFGLLTTNYLFSITIVSG